MGLIKRIPLQLQLLAILAVPAALVWFAKGNGWSLRWYTVATLLFALPTLLAFFRTQDLLTKARADKLDEQANERFMTSLAYTTVLTAGMVGLTFAESTSPVWGPIVIGVEALWILLWWPLLLRRVGVRTSVVIHRDPSVVFAFVSDFQNAPRYIPQIESVEKLTDGPIRSGTQFGTRTRMSSQVFEGVEEIVDYEPPTRLTSRVSSAQRPNLEVLTFEPVQPGTLLKHHFESQLSYPSALMGQGLFRWPMTIQMWLRRRAAWARLRQILESGQPGVPIPLGSPRLGTGGPPRSG